MQVLPSDDGKVKIGLQPAMSVENKAADGGIWWEVFSSPN